MVLTDEAKQDVYPAATLENGATTTEVNYYDINTSNIVVNPVSLPHNYQNNNGNPPYNNHPTVNTSANSTQMYKLNGANGSKTGLGITLKVMAGDVVNIFGKSFWHNSGSSPNNGYPINNLLTDIFTNLAGSNAVTTGKGGAVTANVLSNNTPTTTGIQNLINNSQPNSGNPKAAVNWILFDEQFKVTNYGFNMVGDADVIKAYTMQADITKNGYLYVYCSNESNLDVFFDNLQLIHTRGALLEETHYYPFGLTMSGISSKAAGSLDNKRKWNKGSQFESKEFSDGSGLELYSTFYRSLDPQLGRFWQIDPKPDYAQSLYTSMSNNPIKFNDPLGDTARIHFRTGFLSFLGIGKKRAVDYNNGGLTNTDGTAYTGKVKGFLKKVVGGLDKLSAGGATGKGLVNDIVKSTQTVNIIKGDNAFSANDKTTGMTNVVRWDPSNTNGGPDAALNQSRPAFIGLGHELAHAQDNIFDGKIDYNRWYIPTGGTNPVRMAEIYSTHIENLLRAENKINLRAFYSLYTNAAGITIGEGQILLPGTRQNANTITANGLNLINPFY